MPARKLLITCLLVLLPLSASAESITLDFTGTASIHNGDWANQGTEVTGWFTYDSELANTPNLADNTNKFLSNNPDNAGLHYELVIMLGGTQVAFDESDGFFNFTLMDKPGDIYSFSFVGQGTNASIGLYGDDDDAVAGVTGSVPQAAPDLDLFGSPATAGRVGTQLKFTFDSITLRPGPPGAVGPPGAAVPEPSAALLFGMGFLVVGRAVRRCPAA